MSTLLPNINEKLAPLQIGNMLTTAIKRKLTQLQTYLGLLIKENKRLLQIFSQLGITCTHDEGLRFRKSAATAGVKSAKLSGICDAREGLIQSLADNFDANINSSNGMLSTHSLAILLTQPEISTSTMRNQKIKCLSKSEMTEPIDFEVRTRNYHGTKDVNMPRTSKETVESLKNLPRTN